MMPVIRLNDATFADLSALKTWYGTKTPSETIDRIVREAMEQLDMERDAAAEEVTVTTSDGAMHFDAAPGLAFTKPLAASINGKALHSPCWSALLLTMIAQVKTKASRVTSSFANLPSLQRLSGMMRKVSNSVLTLESRCRASLRRIAGKRWSGFLKSGPSRCRSNSGGSRTLRRSTLAKLAFCGLARRPPKGHAGSFYPKLFVASCFEAVSRQLFGVFCPVPGQIGGPSSTLVAGAARKLGSDGLNEMQSNRANKNLPPFAVDRFTVFTERHRWQRVAGFACLSA